MKTPIVQPKNTFEESLDKLDMQGLLLLLTVLSQKALYLNSTEVLDKKPILKPNSLVV